MDDIIIVNLIHQEVSYDIIIVGCYLPPQNSLYGRDALYFHSHMLSYMYQYYNCDAVYMCGDLNSKLGKSPDFIPGIDELTHRKVIDCATNSHGKALQEFLLDSKCCVLNGRVTPQCDNYNFIEPSRGKSVVGYFITTIDVLKKRVEFHVYSSRTLIDMFMYADSLPINSIPGHSFLFLRISTEPDESTQNSLGSVNRPAQVFRLPLVIKQHDCHVTQSNRLTFSISGSKQTNHLKIFVNQTLHKRP